VSDRLTGQRISGQTVNRIVQKAANDAGLEEMRFTAHSLRSGFISHSFQQGGIANSKALSAPRATRHNI
jgi:site-specific recombinase XerD